MRREVLKFISLPEKKDQLEKFQAHVGVWLDKYLTTDTAKAELVKQVSQLSEPTIYKSFFGRWKAQLEKLSSATEDMVLVQAEFKAKGRMVIGLGGAGVLETSMALHRTYGVPYIPGSALKGLCSSYAHQRLTHTAWKKSPSQGSSHATIFGNIDSAGYVTFFDALPSSFMIHPDVLTPHHQDYNGGKDAPPADWDSPIPVPFLSCDGTFLIAFSAPAEWQDSVLEVLKLALTDFGIGAKTSSGYGRLEFIQVLQSTEDEKVTKLLNEINNPQTLKRNDIPKPKGQGGARDYAMRIISLETTISNKLQLKEALMSRVTAYGDRNLTKDIKQLFERANTT